MPNLNGLYIFGDFMSGYVLQLSKIYLNTFLKKRIQFECRCSKIMFVFLFFANCKGSVYRGFDVLANALLC